MFTSKVSVRMITTNNCSLNSNETAPVPKPTTVNNYDSTSFKSGKTAVQKAMENPLILLLKALFQVSSKAPEEVKTGEKVLYKLGKSPVAKTSTKGGSPDLKRRMMPIPQKQDV